MEFDKRNKPAQGADRTITEEQNAAIPDFIKSFAADVGGTFKKAAPLDALAFAVGTGDGELVTKIVTENRENEEFLKMAPAYLGKTMEEGQAKLDTILNG